MDEIREVAEAVGFFMEAIGVVIIAVGGIYGIVSAYFLKGERSYYITARREFGKPLILGLEVLVAADIIETITVDRSLESIAALGLLVIIRILLSFALDIEVDGAPPWRRAQLERESALMEQDRR